MVHPQCRGYVHRTVVIFNFLQTHSSDLRTQLQIFSAILTYALSCSTFLPKPSAHSGVEVVHALIWDFTFLPKPSTHLATEVIHALSWDLTFLPKSSTHSAVEVVHALNWDLTLNPKIGLSSFASNHHTSKVSKS